MFYVKYPYLTDQCTCTVFNKSCPSWNEKKWDRHNFTGKDYDLWGKSVNGYYQAFKQTKLSSMQGVLLGLLLLPLFYKFVLQIWIHFSRLINSEAHVAEGRTFDGIGKSIVFYASLAVMLILIVPEWMQLVQEFHMHPVLWYAFLSNLHR